MAKNQPKQDVTDAELAVMEVLWASPATIRGIRDRPYPRGGAAHYTTVQKLLERLQTKALLRRPAVAHALWVLVLLKLITPPLLPVPVRWGAATETPRAVSTAIPRTAIATASSTPSPPSVILTPVTPTNVTVEHRDRSRLPLNWLPILMTSWTCGSVV